VNTTAKETIQHFVGLCPAWQARLDSWRADPRYSAKVVPFVENMSVSVLYRLSPESIEAVCRRTEHALGNIRRETAQSVRSIVDWNPSFALEHTLHHAVEALGEVPAYQEFRDFCAQPGSVGDAMLGQPARIAVRDAMSAGATRKAARDALRWRVGNAYLSFLKEAYVLTVLRHDLRVDARYHPLADVLFRVDCWAGHACVELYVGNAKFKDGRAGRKPGPLPCPRITIVPLRLPTVHVFGTVHLPDRQVIADAWRAAVAT
jgi:hypothetical protein